MNTNIKILFGAFAFYIAQNWYFGWNMKPLSPAEGVCDMLVIVIGLTALLWGKK